MLDTLFRSVHRVCQRREPLARARSDSTKRVWYSRGSWRAIDLGRDGEETGRNSGGRVKEKCAVFLARNW